MNTFTFTDNELALVRRAVEVQNDIINDTLLENVSAVNLWAQEPIIVNPEQLKALRDEIAEAMDTMLAVRSLMQKLGLSVNDMGYSV
jgi:hypothetical protein